MKTPDFNKAKIGDRVWSSIRGWGVILDNRAMHNVVLVEFVNNDQRFYNLDGTRSSSDKDAELHWEEFDIPETKPPRRKVTKWITGVYTQFTKNRIYIYGNNMYPKFYNSIVEAQENLTEINAMNRMAFIVPVSIYEDDYGGIVRN
jgi:hypothetical protein